MSSRSPPFLSAADPITPAALHAAFEQAFADYLIGPFRVPLDRWQQFLGRQGADLGLSRVALRDEQVLAFCLVAPRAECRSWRLATMGAVPAARGSGAAPALLDDLLARAGAAGVAVVELECFAQNTRALRLYEGRGFTLVDELHGYIRAAGEALPSLTGSAQPRPVDLPAACAWLTNCQAEGLELPLQVTPRSLQALPGDLLAWQLGRAQVVFSFQPEARLQIHSLVDHEPAQQHAQRLVAALLAEHPDHSVHVPQLQRHRLGGAALERLGFARLPLHQVWMRRAA